MTTIKNMTPTEVYERMQSGERIDLVDVRTPQEYAQVHAVGARSVPLDGLTKDAVMRDAQAAPADPIYVICKSGGRSRSACGLLQQQGLDNVVNVEGGTMAWEQAGLPVEKATSGSGAGINWIRVGGLAVVALSVLLGMTLSPYFFWAAAGIWIAMAVTGNSPCCGGSCSPRART
jgi:rhodanese-related sulfurtransferase